MMDFRARSPQSQKNPLTAVIGKPTTAVIGKGHADLSAKYTDYKEKKRGTPLVVQWLRLHTPNAGTPGSIPG